MKTLLIVGAILKEDGRILLVQQQWEQDPHPYWTIPGGRVEHGEFYAEALVREVYEETGLMVEKIGGLVYTNHILASDHDGQSIIHVYRVDSWIGDVIPNDPDGFILSARFVPIPEAIRLIADSQFYAPMRDPVVAYLRGEVPFGTAWQYRRITVEDVTLISRLV
ncbi:MAG: NUDIX domain-containing protein [Chloroflexi bacterium]|nr:NUDIX domain-containing protein [Chloroflexota bacterium]